MMCRSWRVPAKAATLKPIHSSGLRGDLQATEPTTRRGIRSETDQRTEKRFQRGRVKPWCLICGQQ